MYIYPTGNYVKAICTDMIFTTIPLFLKWRLITDTELSAASLEGLDDSISLRSNEELGVDSDVIKICPGDMVVALGRFFEKPNDLMAAPGRLSLDNCNLDCKELFRANCKISMRKLILKFVHKYRVTGYIPLRLTPRSTRLLLNVNGHLCMI